MDGGIPQRGETTPWHEMDGGVDIFNKQSDVGMGTMWPCFQGVHEHMAYAGAVCDATHSN